MDCVEIHGRMRDWTRGVSPMPAEVGQHLLSCRECAVVWERERQLTAAFVELRAEREQPRLSPRVADAVDAAFVAGRRERAPARWRALAGMAAAVLLVLAGLLAWVRAGKSDGTAADGSAAQARLAGGAPRRYTEFFPLSAAGFDQREASHVIRIRLPRGELRRFGLPVQEGLERYSIEADVVIGQDGFARAVRFVQ